MVFFPMQITIYDLNFIHVVTEKHFIDFKEGMDVLCFELLKRGWESFQRSIEDFNKDSLCLRRTACTRMSLCFSEAWVVN